MNTWCRTVLSSLVISLVLAGSPEARPVYLRDGAVLTAQAAWRSGGSVNVLVNHEEELTFPASEVDVKKTFPRRALRKASHLKQLTAPKPVMTGISSARVPAAPLPPSVTPAAAR